MRSRKLPRMKAVSAIGIEAISSMQLIITARDKGLARYGNQLALLGEGKARTAMWRALNHEGDKGRTQVKRALVKQTGIKYGVVEKAMATVRATPATLTYTLKARGDETNIAWFGGVQRRKGVSAAPWSKRRIFRHAFIGRGSVAPSSAPRRAACRSGRSTAPTSRASW